MKEPKILNKALRPLIQSVQYGDEKLIRVAMHLMKLRTGAPRPIHPKNVLHSQSEEHWFEAYLPRGEGKVLDLGAGTGSLSMLAAQRGANVVALEGNLNNIQLLESLRRKLPDPKNFSVIRHDLEVFPYPVKSGEFDVVLSHDVIEHLHRRHEHLGEAARALKVGGKLVIAGPKRDTTWKLVRGHFGLSMLADEDHKIEYTRDEFLKELRIAGFQRILFESTAVVDAPINGLIDLVGPISLSVYEKLVNLKAWLAVKFPRETSGFRLVLEK